MPEDISRQTGHRQYQHRLDRFVIGSHIIFDKKLLRKIIFCLNTINVCTFLPSVVTCELGSAQLSKKCINERRKRRTSPQYYQYRDEYDQDDQRHQPPFLSLFQKLPEIPQEFHKQSKI